MPSTDLNHKGSRRDASMPSTLLARAVLTGAMVIGAVALGAEGRKLIVADHLDPQEAKETLRSVLKDPDKIDSLVKVLTRDTALGDDLVDDPDIMRNLTKLANAMIERENSRKGLTVDTRLKNWAKDVDKGQSGLLEELFPHLRPQPPKRSF